MKQLKCGVLPVAGFVLSVIIGSLAGCATSQATAVSQDAPAAAVQTATVQTGTVQATAAQKAENPDRPTARPWTGDPTGPNGAFEDPDRAHTLRIEDVMDHLGIKKGSVVADIGAGGGWFTMIAARRVGPTGIVYGQEISGRYTRYIRRRAEREKLKNVRTILGTPTDPKLPANSIDAVLILNAYHEFGEPLTMLRKIRAGMKAGARLGFIERDNEKLREEAREAYEKTGKIKRRVTEQKDSKEYTDDHRLALPIVEREAAQAGFRKVMSMELRDDHYLLVVTRD